MSISEFVGFLFPAVIGLAWLILEVMLHRKFSHIKNLTAAIDAKNKPLKVLLIAPKNHLFGIKSVHPSATDAPL